MPQRSSTYGHQAPEDGDTCIVPVTLDRCDQVVQLLRCGFTTGGTDRSSCSCGHDCGAGTEPAGSGHGVVDDQPDRTPDGIGRHPAYIVSRSGLEGFVQFFDHPTISEVGINPAVEVKRQTEAIESWSEIRRRSGSGGCSNGHRRDSKAGQPGRSIHRHMSPCRVASFVYGVTARTRRSDQVLRPGSGH